MSKIKKILSCILAVALVLAVFPLGSVCSSATGSTSADASLVLNRPSASVIVTDITRVAYQTDSMKAPSGNNSVIVKSTPSGMPYLSSTRNFLAYAGETPVATTIVFTPCVVLDEEPTLSCNNSTVKWSSYAYSNGTYTWTVTGGTAVVGTTLVFTVGYTYSDVNAVTGKTYSHTYSTTGTSYVEAIATPAGLNSTKRTYTDWGLGTTTQNRSYLGSYILGKNTYGSIYNDGGADGSIAFGTSAWITYGSFTDEYGVMQSMDNADSSRDYNVAYKLDSNRPMSTVYYDSSITSTLSDLNLRAVSVIMAQADEEDERVTVTMKNAYMLDGFVEPLGAADDEVSVTSDTTASAQLNIVTPTTSLYSLASNFTAYFTGTGPSVNTGTTDYTVILHYQTAAGWSDVRVSHSYNLRIVSYDKGALRTLVENVQSTDPTVKITELPDGDFKGYNPQYWYYASGWEYFLSSLNSARACLEKPNVTQQEIDNAYNTLLGAYDGLEMATADYTSTQAIYNQAMAKNPDNYTLASWARLQTLLDEYRADYSVLYQPAVDKMGTDIKAAMDALEEKYADYSLLLGHLTTVNNLAKQAQSVYNKEPSEVYVGWDNLISVLTKSGCTYNELDGYTVENYLLISDQATVDGYVLLIEKALNNITLAGADYTAANKAESAYRLINISYVVDDIANELVTAYNALVALHSLDISHQAEVDAATANLNEVLARVEYKPADTTAAEEKLAYAYGIDRTKYDDFTAVDRAIATLESKLTLDIRYQSEINRAVSALQSAIDALSANAADYTLVDEALEAVAAKERLILETYEDTYGFTAATFYSNWSAVTTAINNVVRGLDSDHQSQVNNYAEAITTALANLTENTADYTRVNSLKSTAYQICTTGSSLYTSESISNLLNAYSSVENGLTISQQSVVDGYAASIQQAIDELEYLPASYTNVNTQIASANEKIAADEAYSEAHPGYTLYTPESLAAVEVAIAEVVDGLDIRYQTTVNGYATSISTAISNLVYAPADYTAVYAALATVPEDTSIYTTLSLSTLNSVIKNINYTYTAEKQTTVDKYVTSINSALAKLKLKSADYSAVNTAISAVPTDSSVYTEDSWQALQDQVNAVVYNLDITHQDEVDLYAQNINTALGLLAYKGADYTAVDNAKATIPDDLSIYTEESQANLEAALNAVDYYCNITQQATVDGYATAITNAVAALVELSADYTAVNNAITAANEKINSGLYTNESVTAVQQAINAVVEGYGISRQDEVTAFAVSITTASDAMTYKNADYTAVNNAKATIPDDLSIYTEESRANLEAALNAVDYNCNITQQTTVDGYATAITNAVSALVELPADYSAVNSAIATANEKINSGLYTDESVTAVQQAINAVVEGYGISRQSEVTAFATNITAASDAMIYKNADYSAVNTAITEANEKIATGWYTDETVSALTTEIDKVVYNLDITHQSEVDEYANSIVKATKDLALKLADYTELKNILNLLDNSASEIYTITCTNFTEVMALIDAYRAENVKMDVTIDRQSEVDEMASTLQGYIDSLIPAPTESFSFVDGVTLKTTGGVKYVSGFKATMSKSQFKSFYESENTTVSVVCAVGTRIIGTGSVVTVTSNTTGEVLGEYVIVIFGDVDGDGKITTEDTNKITSVLDGRDSFDSNASKLAANVQGTRATVNQQDLEALNKVVVGTATINQSTGKVEE